MISDQNLNGCSSSDLLSSEWTARGWTSWDHHIQCLRWSRWLDRILGDCFQESVDHCRQSTINQRTVETTPCSSISHQHPLWALRRLEVVLRRIDEETTRRNSEDRRSLSDHSDQNRSYAFTNDLHETSTSMDAGMPHHRSSSRHSSRHIPTDRRNSRESQGRVDRSIDPINPQFVLFRNSSSNSKQKPWISIVEVDRVKNVYRRRSFNSIRIQLGSAMIADSIEHADDLDSISSRKSISSIVRICLPIWLSFITKTSWTTSPTWSTRLNLITYSSDLEFPFLSDSNWSIYVRCPWIGRRRKAY